MQNGSKYVPPHLRNQASGASSSGSASKQSNNNYRGGNNANGNANANRPTNSRWSNVDTSSSGGSGGGRGYGGGRRGYGSRYNSGPQRNERGFHGDMRPDARLERELFHKEIQQTTGINFEKYDQIPCETSGNDVPEPIAEYTVDTIGEDLIRNTGLCGYTKPTPVQKYSVPIGSAGRDMMACAQTGSGKTAGFLFPVIMSMCQKGGNTSRDGSASRKSFPQALVLAPTRELASQIYEEARKFTYCTGISSVVVYGGADVREQLRNLEQRGCDLLIATPGRLVDLMERGRISLEDIQFLVLDEADRMLDMGFEPQIRRIVETEGMPASMDGRQTMMFSATFPVQMQRMASDFMMDYVFVTVGRVGSASKDVGQVVEFVENQDKLDVLMNFLLTIEEGLILVFVETKRSADYIEDVLCGKGFPACSIHGDKDQREREHALRSFKRGVTPVMVATDVASRGLDIPNVTNVINFDLPSSIDDYVHRIGRTGRAGNTGHALSFVNEGNAPIIRDLYNLLQENDQEAPSWLKSMCQYTGGGRGRGGGRRNNGSSFGGRDYRKDEGKFSNSSSNNYNRGGHSHGGHGGQSHGGGYGNRGGGYSGGYGGGGGGGFSSNSAW